RPRHPCDVRPGADAGTGPACQTGAMVRDEIRRRWGAGIAWLRHSTGQSPQLTLWGWVGDALVALVLAIGAIAGVTYHNDAPNGTGVGAIVARPGSSPLTGRVARPARAAPVPTAPDLRGASGIVPLPGPMPGDGDIAWWMYGVAALPALPLAARRR